MNLPDFILNRNYNFVQHSLLRFVKVNSRLEYPFDIFDTNQLKNVPNLNNLVICNGIIV